jgi:hypothetical protein
MGILIFFGDRIRNWIDSAGTVYFNALEWRIDLSPGVEAIAPIVKAIPSAKTLGFSAGFIDFTESHN